MIGDQWPGFLGAGASPIDPAKVKTTWSPKENIAWKLKTPGHGQSSPVVWGEHVFVTAIEGPKKEKLLVLGVNLADGKETFRYSADSSDPVENSVYVSRAAPTPIVDAKRVIAFFESGDIVALDHSGKELWKKSLVQEYGRFQNKFGLSGSPVQTESTAFILVDDEGPSYLLAVDKESGKTLWKAERTPRASWSSPAIVEVGGEPQVVVSSGGSIDGYSPKDGALLWSFTEVGGNTGTTPMDLGGGRFLVAGSAGRDGQNAELAGKSNMLMQVTKSGDQYEAKPVWRVSEATPSWGSPIIHSGCAYWVNRQGVVYCFNAETGELHYKERTKQSCWATPIGIGDRVYFFGKDGLTTVIATGPEFKVLAENQLWNPDEVEVDADAGKKEPTEERRRAAGNFSGPIQYGYAIVGNSIVIREGSTLYCVR